MSYVAAALLNPGAVVAGYRIERLIGRGGMGVVYEATQLSLDRSVALKVISPRSGDDPVFRGRFRREALGQAALEHASIATVYDAGESEAGLFLAMRLVRGSDLRTLILRGELSQARTIGILRQVANALDAAHAAGFVHRDVKPQNVLVEDGDRAYLADFGLARTVDDPSLTASGTHVGSALYLAPEQIRGTAATPRTDVYALGAVLFECLARKPPFPRESYHAVLAAHLFDRVPRIGERGIDEVVACAMAKRPAGRFASAGELVRAAERALDPGGATRDVPVERRRSRAMVGAATAGALVLAVAGVVAGRASAPAGVGAVELSRVEIHRHDRVVAALGRLRVSRAAERARLLRVPTSQAQARAARRLAEAYRAAARASPAAPLAASLDRAAAAYTALAAAAARHDEPAYAAARGAVARGEAAVSRVLAR